MTTTLTTTKTARQGPSAYVYFVHADESIPENLLWRRRRRVQWYLTLLPAVLRDAKVEVLAEDQDAIARARWDLKAGCTCGCSPGFVLDSPEPCELYVWIDYRVSCVDQVPSTESVTQTSGE